MELFSKRLLSTRKKQPEYTLKVVTTPTAASCTLTYNGVGYNVKTLTVPEGSVISYYIYDTTYGKTTGSITMNRDKTLTAKGVKNEEIVEVTWSQPKLTANGTIGGKKFAVEADGEYTGNNKAFHAFDNNASTFWRSTPWLPKSITFYNPNPLKVTNLKIYNANKYEPYIVDYVVYGSNNNSSWTKLTSGTNTNYTIGSSWNISMSSNKSYYKYYKIKTETCRTSGGQYAIIAECKITATTKTTKTTYTWEKSVT